MQTRIADYDRIVFAALAPSPQTSGVLKMACRTWEDHLWTQVAIVFEEKISTELNRLGGGFWEGGLLAAEEGVHIPTPEEEDQEERPRKTRATWKIGTDIICLGSMPRSG